MEGGQHGCRATCQEAKVVVQEKGDGGLDQGAVGEITENVRCKNLFRREKKNIQDVRQRDAPKITPVSGLPN